SPVSSLPLITVLARFIFQFYPCASRQVFPARTHMREPV
ncbi:hypothetical protein ALC56_07320, partial [Trachymyrmex septentrionalis]